MTDREKLVELLEDATKETVDGIRFRYKFETVEQFADYLIAHGVTVRKMRKPLTLDEAIEMSKDEHAIFYVEDNVQNSIVRSEYWGAVNFWLNKCVEKQKHRNSYGRLWRCWAKRPTEEERKAAEWME